MKGNAVPLHAKQARRGARSIALPIVILGDRRGLGGQRHAPAALPPGKRPGACFTGG